MSQKTPSGFRIHVGFIGRRNVGKSSLLNALTCQTVAIVSDTPGTTTDPIFKPFEDHEIGPILLIDTAGLDDEGALGESRVKRTRKILRRLDVAILVFERGCWGRKEEDLLLELQKYQASVIIVQNKIETDKSHSITTKTFRSQRLLSVDTDAVTGKGIEDLKISIRKAVADAAVVQEQQIVSDLLNEHDVAVLVIPIDSEAPRGRLILPQVQCLRDLLDHGKIGLVVRDRELKEALEKLDRPPGLVVTDSQAFKKVAEIVPREIPLTSFSILFARLKGDLDALIQGTRSLLDIQPGNKILIAEACSHHPIRDDIAHVKIPKWIKALVGGNISFSYCRGHEFPDDISNYDLVIHCGACTLNKREVIWRIEKCRQDQVPITNYGLTIASCVGILERAIEPFRQQEFENRQRVTATTYENEQSESGL